MKRIVNFRPAATLALSIGLGAGFSYLSVYNSFPLWWLIALVPVTAALLIVFIVRRNTKGIIITAICAALFLYGAVGVCLKLSAFGNVSLADGALYTVSGTVWEKGLTESGEYIKLGSIIAGGQSVEGNMIVYLGENYGKFCDVGYSVTFYGVTYVTTPFAYGGESAARILEDIRYSASPVGLLSSEYGFSLFGYINSAIRSLFFDNLSGDSAAIAYAMFTGNTEYIHTSTMDSFRYGGVAHVFAVSGLHIVLIYGIVTFILKKLHTPKVPASLISVAIVFFYTGMCGFTLSAVRAAIMCAVSAVVRLSRGKYDSLSSVALSFLVITLVNPLNVISVGFQLSIAAVVGIAVFNGSICRALMRIKIPEKIASSASVSLSAQIGTFPILLSSFGYVSWASLGLNIIFVPVISAVFMIMFPCTLLALIIPPLAQFLLMLTAVPLDLTTAALVAIHAEDALISGFDFGAFAPCYFLAVFVFSGMVNLKIGWRALIALVLCAVLVAGVALRNYVPAGGIKVIASAYHDGSYSVLIKTEEGNVLVISETPSSYSVGNLLDENGAEDLEAVIILGGEESIFAYNLLGAECNDLYVYYSNIALQPYHGVEVHYEREFTVCGIGFEYIDGYDIVAEYSGINVGISCGESVGIEQCDLLISVQSTDGCEYRRAVFFEQVNFAYNVYDCGNLQFIVKDGTISPSGTFARKGVLIW